MIHASKLAVLEHINEHYYARDGIAVVKLAEFEIATGIDMSKIPTHEGWIKYNARYGHLNDHYGTPYTIGRAKPHFETERDGNNVPIAR